MKHTNIPPTPVLSFHILRCNTKKQFQMIPTEQHVVVLITDPIPRQLLVAQRIGSGIETKYVDL